MTPRQIANPHPATLPIRPRVLPSWHWSRWPVLVAARMRMEELWLPAGYCRGDDVTLCANRVTRGKA